MKKKSTISDLNQKIIKQNMHESYDPELARFYKKDRRQAKGYKRAKNKSISRRYNDGE